MVEMRSSINHISTFGKREFRNFVWEAFLMIFIGFPFGFQLVTCQVPVINGHAAKGNERKTNENPLKMFLRQNFEIPSCQESYMITRMILSR